MGISLIVSFNYGRRDHKKQLKTFSISMKLILFVSVIATFICLQFGGMVVSIFAVNNEIVQMMALHGFYVVAISFIWLGRRLVIAAGRRSI